MRVGDVLSFSQLGTAIAHALCRFCCEAVRFLAEALCTRSILSRSSVNVAALLRVSVVSTFNRSPVDSRPCAVALRLKVLFCSFKNSSGRSALIGFYPKTLEECFFT